MLYEKWLDNWDERRVEKGNKPKTKSAFMLGADLAFPNSAKVGSIREFCELAVRACEDPEFFAEQGNSDAGFELNESWLKFPSDISTDIEQNNTVWAKVTRSAGSEMALIVFHHWNAENQNRLIADFFKMCGITVLEIALPYHFQRSRPGAAYADYMISANIGRTIQSVRQGVVDGRKVIRWLRREGYSKISVFGMSLGSWVAGLVAAHDKAVSKASLFLTAGSLADMVWTGRATEALYESISDEVELADLRKAWSPLNLENYSKKLARSDLDLQVILANRDKVVLPELSHNFLRSLEYSGCAPDFLELNCGHYSSGLPPYILIAGFRLKSLLGRY